MKLRVSEKSEDSGYSFSLLTSNTQAANLNATMNSYLSISLNASQCWWWRSVFKGGCLHA